jgi:hypothetical protein
MRCMRIHQPTSQVLASHTCRKGLNSERLAQKWEANRQIWKRKRVAWTEVTKQAADDGEDPSKKRRETRRNSSDTASSQQPSDNANDIGVESLFNSDRYTPYHVAVDGFTTQLQDYIEGLSQATMADFASAKRYLTPSVIRAKSKRTTLNKERLLTAAKAFARHDFGDEDCRDTTELSLRNMVASVERSYRDSDHQDDPTQPSRTVIKLVSRCYICYTLQNVHLRSKNKALSEIRIVPKKNVLEISGAPKLSCQVRISPVKDTKENIVRDWLQGQCLMTTN